MRAPNTSHRHEHTSKQASKQKQAAEATRERRAALFFLFFAHLNCAHSSYIAKSRFWRNEKVPGRNNRQQAKPRNMHAKKIRNQTPPKPKPTQTAQPKINSAPLNFPASSDTARARRPISLRTVRTRQRTPPLYRAARSVRAWP